MSKKLESKLANSVRQAKQQNETAATSASATTAKPATESTSTAATKFASQADQTPKPSLDNPWANLYPARIWPD